LGVFLKAATPFATAVPSCLNDHAMRVRAASVNGSSYSTAIVALAPARGCPPPGIV
jgi:hypothetical protein